MGNEKCALYTHNMSITCSDLPSCVEPVPVDGHTVSGALGEDSMRCLRTPSAPLLISPSLPPVTASL